MVTSGNCADEGRPVSDAAQLAWRAWATLRAFARPLRRSGDRIPNLSRWFPRTQTPIAGTKDTLESAWRNPQREHKSSLVAMEYFAWCFAFPIAFHYQI